MDRATVIKRETDEPLPRTDKLPDLVKALSIIAIDDLFSDDKDGA
jgi:hypothetical protein